MTDQEKYQEFIKYFEGLGFKGKNVYQKANEAFSRWKISLQADAKIATQHLPELTVTAPRITKLVQDNSDNSPMFSGVDTDFQPEDRSKFGKGVSYNALLARPFERDAQKFANGVGGIVAAGVAPVILGSAMPAAMELGADAVSDIVIPGFKNVVLPTLDALWNPGNYVQYIPKVGSYLAKGAPYLNSLVHAAGYTGAGKNIYNQVTKDRSNLSFWDNAKDGTGLALDIALLGHGLRTEGFTSAKNAINTAANGISKFRNAFRRAKFGNIDNTGRYIDLGNGSRVLLLGDVAPVSEDSLYFGTLTRNNDLYLMSLFDDLKSNEAWWDSEGKPTQSLYDEVDRIINRFKGDGTENSTQLHNSIFMEGWDPSRFQENLRIFGNEIRDFGLSNIYHSLPLSREDQIREFIKMGLDRLKIPDSEFDEPRKFFTYDVLPRFKTILLSNGFTDKLNPEQLQLLYELTADPIKTINFTAGYLPPGYAGMSASNGNIYYRAGDDISFGYKVHEMHHNWRDLMGKLMKGWGYNILDKNYYHENNLENLLSSNPKNNEYIFEYPLYFKTEVDAMKNMHFLKDKESTQSVYPILEFGAANAERRGNLWRNYLMNSENTGIGSNLSDLSHYSPLDLDRVIYKYFLPGVHRFYNPYTGTSKSLLSSAYTDGNWNIHSLSSGYFPYMASGYLEATRPRFKSLENKLYEAMLWHDANPDPQHISTPWYNAMLRETKGMDPDQLVKSIHNSVYDAHRESPFIVNFINDVFTTPFNKIAGYAAPVGIGTATAASLINNQSNLPEVKKFGGKLNYLKFIN